MTKFKRSEENPVLIPYSENDWEAEAVFNGCPVRNGRDIHFVYRAVSRPQIVSGTEMRVSSIGYAASSDGIHFRDRRQLIKPEYDWERFGCEDPRVTRLGDKYYIFYTALSTYPFSAEGIKIGLAITRDFKEIEAKYPVTPFNAKAMALFPSRIGGKGVAVLTANTDKPPAKIGLAYFDREEQMWSPDYWQGWYSFLDDHVLPLQRTPQDHIEVGAPPIQTKEGWLLFYSYIRNYFSPPATFGIEAVLLDLEDPSKILARTEEPLLVPQDVYEKYGRAPNIVFPSGAMVRGKKLYLYYGAADSTCALATGSLSSLIDEMLRDKARNIRMERFAGNPIITPKAENSWESRAAFNPAAVYEDGKVHLLYRAMSEDNTSVFGYASSRDGFHIDERLDEPVYVPREEFEKKHVPNGNSGCEDARLTKIGDRFYLCYTAYDSYLPRVAMSSIAVSDFLAKRWEWKKPVIISPPGIDDKDAAVFPRKIGGKYAFLHRVGNSIWLDFSDDLEFTGEKRIKGNIIMSPRQEPSAAEKIGIAGPPIETEWGWLLLYHVVAPRGQRIYYFFSAALLNIDQPSQVIARCKTPILEPEMPYEIHGQVADVVFPCGAVIIKDRLFAYYGGGDSVIGVATIRLADLFEGLFLESGLRPKVEAAAGPPLPWVTYGEFIPGVPLELPAELASPGGEKVDIAAIYKDIEQRYQGEFDDFIHERLKVPRSGGAAEVAGGVRAFMERAEKELAGSLLPGDLCSVEGTRQVIEAIFAAFSRGDTFALKPEVCSRILAQFPPRNLLIKFGRATAAEMEKQYGPNEILTLASLSEEREYMDRLWDWIWKNARPEHFGPLPPRPLIVSYEDFPSLMEMKDTSALSKLSGMVVVSNLSQGMGGEFPTLRYLTTVVKNIIEAERFGEIWKGFAQQKRGFKKKVINSLEGHWGREPLSAHNIFENQNQRLLVQRLREMAADLEKIGKHPAAAGVLLDMAAGYHLARSLPDGQFVPCSAWTWASYSFKGGKGTPTSLSLHVERDWVSRELLMALYQAAGGSEAKMDMRIAELMGREKESENLAKVLFPDTK